MEGKEEPLISLDVLMCFLATRLILEIILYKADFISFEFKKT